MNELAKTLTFVGVAVAAVLLAVYARPTLSTTDPEDLRGQLLYPAFTDPLAVTSLEITEFDEDTAKWLKFKVAQIDVKGKTRWVIPSHGNYPADAKDQVAAAAASLMGLKILEVVGEEKANQREYGVIDPTSETLDFGDTGVGEQVVMRDKAGKELLALVIGKKVNERPELRYVRKVGEDPIYVVKVNTDNLSTKFEDWIERNLLGMESWDMKRLWIQDYSIDLEDNPIPSSNIQIEYNDAGDPRWKLLVDRQVEKGKWVDKKLAEDEELNVTKLDEMRTALDDLKIVNVSPKPAGLSANLKGSSELVANQEIIESLRYKGFKFLPVGDQMGLFSDKGELCITMKDGVEYVLRFGEIAGGAAKKDDKPKKEGKQGEAEKPSVGLNRYLFVMAQFNPDVIPKPKFEPLPEEKKPAEQKPAEDNKAAQPKPEDKAAGEKKPVPQPPEQKMPGDEKAEEKKPDEKTPDEKKAAAEKPPEKQPEKTPEQAAAELKAQREWIEKENKRKQDEYDRTLADGKKRVDELNARFADWYYVISDDVFQKIHLTRDELIKKKEKPKTGDKNAADEHAPAGGAEELAFPPEVLEKLKPQKPEGKK